MHFFDVIFRDLNCLFFNIYVVPYFLCFILLHFCWAFVFFIIFQFPGGLPPPGLSSALGLPPSAGVPPRLDLPPGVSMGQPNSGNNMNHEKVKTGAKSTKCSWLEVFIWGLVLPFLYITCSICVVFTAGHVIT